MQSILLTTPSKTSKIEVNQEIKVAYDVTNIEEKGGEEKSSGRFAIVMESLIKGKNELTDGESPSKIISSKDKTEDAELAPILPENKLIVTEPVDELQSNKVSLISSGVALEDDVPKETEPLSTDKGFSSNNNTAKNNTEIELLATDETLSDISASPIPLASTTISENETFEVTPESDITADKALRATSDSVEISESIEGKNNNDLTVVDIDLIKVSSESNLQLTEQVISPIIAQIESAQIIDTSINDLKPKVVSSEVNTSVKDTQVIDKYSLKEIGKTEKVTFENVLVDDPDATDNQGKELIGKNNLPSNEKLDAILPVLKAEMNKPAFNLNVEGNVFNTTGMTASTADKLLNQISGTTSGTVVSPTLQSAALQQPIELQAKHASAMMGERILMMLGQGKQEVTIRLDPAELGSMHIKLQVQQDQLQVTIQTQVGQSRDIIEQNLPRLREQLAQQGINLGEASVEHQSNQNKSNSQDSSQMGNASQSSESRGELFSEDQNEFIATQIPLPAQGIDYYA
jgi:flagellar hook-length control protein FliK